MKPQLSTAALPLAALFGPTAIAMPARVSSNVDAALLDLGRRWEAALTAERAHANVFSDAMSDAEADEHETSGDKLRDVTSGLFHGIVVTPATTAAGLAVKGKVLAYEKDLEQLDEVSVAAALACARYYTDRAAFSLARDCLRIARAAT